MKYIKKPIAIYAIRYTGENADEIKEFAGEKCIIVRDKKQLLIKTLEGIMVANPGSYIIRGVKGEIYPCAPDVFEMSYEEFSPKSRYYRITASLEEMAKATVHSVFWDGKLRYIVGFELPTGRCTIYNSKEEAIFAAKKLLMEN